MIYCGQMSKVLLKWAFPPTILLWFKQNLLFNRLGVSVILFVRVNPGYIIDNNPSTLRPRLVGKTNFAICTFLLRRIVHELDELCLICGRSYGDFKNVKQLVQLFQVSIHLDPSVPSAATHNRKPFQCLNIVLNNKTGVLFLEFEVYWLENTF